MTLSAPSFFAAATSASMPPPAVTEVALDQSVAEPPPPEDEELFELELPQAVAASATPAAIDASLVMRFIVVRPFRSVRRDAGDVDGGSLMLIEQGGELGHAA